AVLETSGQLSVMPKKEAARSGRYEQGSAAAERASKPVVPRIKYEEIPLSLIMDGRVQDRNLEQIGKTRFWLKNQIQARGVKEFKEIFFCSIDHQGKLYINLMQDP